MSGVLLRQMAMLKMLPRAPKSIGTTALKERLAGLGFETTSRTVQRDLLALAEFFPIECHDHTKPYGWRWQQDAAIFEVPAMDPKTALTLKLSAAFLARVLPHETYQRLQGHFRQAETVLGSVPESKLAAWPKKIRVTNAGLPVTFPVVSGEILDVVTRALLEDRRFDCSYQRRDGELRQFDVNPLALVYRDALAFLVCTLNGHEGAVLLMPHRMRTATPRTEARKVPKGFDLDAFVRAGGPGFLMAREPVKLVALVHAKALPTVAELPIASDQTLEPYDDERFVLEATVPSSQELRRWILGFGDAIEVLAPEALRATMQSVFAVLGERYARASGVGGERSPRWEGPHVLGGPGVPWGG